MKIYALINTYNCAETILFTLQSLLGKVDEVIILDGRWIGVEHDDLHSTDGTFDIIANFAKEHLDMPTTILLAERPMHQIESRQYLLDQVPDGEWFLIVDGDEYIMAWMDNLKEFLEETDEKYFAVCGKNPKIKFPTIRFGKKTKGLYYEKNHRWMSDDNGKILVGDLQSLPIQIPQHPKRNIKAMRKTMEKYAKWLYDWEHLNEL